MKTSKQMYFEYINNGFDCEAMGIAADSTMGEKARKFLELIDGRHSNFLPDNVRKHLQGVGEYLEIEFMNHEILSTAKEFGLIDEMLSKKTKRTLEKIEEQILENYWKVMANYVIQMANKK